MAYKNFISELNKDLTGNILFLYGAEEFLTDWAVDQVIAKYVDESARNIDVQYFDGMTCDPSEIAGASRAFSMFSEKRVIVVNDLAAAWQGNRGADAEILTELGGSDEVQAIVIFRFGRDSSEKLTAFGKKLMKSSSAYEFSRLERAELQGFINKRVHAGGKLLGRREMDHLIDLTGYFNRNSEYDLTQLDIDVKKLVNAAEGDSISIDLIEELLVGRIDKYVFNMIDALLNRNKATALEIAETIISEDDGALQVLANLTKQFEIMYDALELSQKGLSLPQIAKTTGVNEYRLKRAFQAARTFGIDAVKEMLIRAYNIDRDFKSGIIDKDVAFELLILSI